MSVSEAIAYVIASLPQQEGVEPLVRFTQPLLADLASIGASETAATDKLQLRRAADRMEQIERFVHITSNTMTEDTLPASCSKTCEEAYGVVDTIIAKYGSTYFVSERACALIRRAMVLFGDLALPVLPHLVVRLVATFERTGFPAYIWIVGKCIDRYGGTKTEASTGADAALSDAFARITQQVVRMLQATSPADIPDGTLSWRSHVVIWCDGSCVHALFLWCSDGRLPAHMLCDGCKTPAAPFPLPCLSSDTTDCSQRP